MPFSGPSERRDGLIRVHQHGKAPYGARLLKREADCPSDVEHRQVEQIWVNTIINSWPAMDIHERLTPPSKVLIVRARRAKAGLGILLW